MADPFRSKLENIIEENNLMDTILKNRKYKWSKKRIGLGNIKEHLDRFLLKDCLVTKFNSIS